MKLTCEGTDTSTGEEVAVKLIDLRRDRGGYGRGLQDEAETYKALAGIVGIPRVHWIGTEGNYSVLVLPLLGPSLEDLFSYCNKRFSLKTILLIADQAISLLERIHNHFLHRDVKPENFLLGVGEHGNTLYAIDFGLANEFSDGSRADVRRGLTYALPFGGTSTFASVDTHKGLEQSWADDLQSLGYMFVYFARGSLPWENLRTRASMQEKKEELSGEELCRGVLPAEFVEYIDYTRSLEFRVKPDYERLRDLFRSRFEAEGFEYDNVFDWTVKRFHEIHGTTSDMA
ncbi:putative casein kinase I isoform delta [Rosellinia necatrix]|uniref:non-specific serine/threonine protein kinase n=1 Tax=Rosellinia necatrix TaxID=77044 RepID=A0A1W2TMA2_ROSNE|nr:putative casein kinase I isoform delta [Rosellinia necatrix]